VKLNGEVWSARVDAAQAIPPGTEVTVSRIDGATAVVSPVRPLASS
jgi:membrane protein implicated in regulation of membrane protease activity